MARSGFMAAIMIGFGLVLIPLVLIGIAAAVVGPNWDTVGQMVALPIMVIYVLALVVFLVVNRG